MCIVSLLRSQQPKYQTVLLRALTTVEYDELQLPELAAENCPVGAAPLLELVIGSTRIKGEITVL